MNKKIAIAFGISIFLGIGYLAYRRTEFGRFLKSKWIIKRMLKDKKGRNINSWDYPEEVIAATMEELMSLDFRQLELVEEYVQLNLNRKGSEVIYGHREAMKLEGVYDRTDLKNLEIMMWNLFGLSNRYGATVPDNEYLKQYEWTIDKKDNKYIWK